MYKTKLQELCHQRSWDLPEYTTTRQGPPHNSRFIASVSVNGLSFSSDAPVRSSKLAQNEAALVAFSHFTSPPPPIPPVNESQSGEVTAVQQNEPEICQSSGSSVAAEVGNAGNSLLIATPETAQIPANEGLSVAEGSSIAINEVNNSGLTKQNAEKIIQTQESGLVAIKNENISLGSSKVTNEINNSELRTPNALETTQSQGSQVFAVAKNDYSSMGSTSQMKEPETNPTVGNERVVAASIDNIYTDVHHLYKNQLQSYTQKRNISFPVYSCEREGPPHACRFRCKVTVDGNIYGSQEFYSTVHKAELAAAKVALMSLLPNGVDQDESGYKNLLQELVQKRGHRLPTYTTRKTGEDHVPTFVSEVEVGGECFIGQEARNKKQAESSAAKVAYTTLKQRDLVTEPALSRCHSQADETTHAPSPLSSQSNFTGPGLATQQLDSNKRQDLSGNSNENLSCLPPSPKRQAVQLSSSSSRADYLTFLYEHVQPSMPVPEKLAEVYPVLDKSSTSRSVSSSSGTSFSSLNEFDQSTPVFASNSSSGSVICSSIEHLVKASTTCKVGVVVHPRQSSMSYPSGSAALPYSNDDWVAVKFTTDSSD